MMEVWKMIVCWKSPKNTLPTLADMEKEAIVGY